MTFRLVSQLNPLVINGDVTMSGGIAQSITGNTAGVPALLSSGTMYLAGGSNITLSQNGQSISIVGGAGGGGGADGLNRLAAGTQTAGTLATIKFADSNGISFGMSNSTQITASYTVPSQSVQTQNMVSILGSTGDISFANGNGITFGGNNSTLTASHNGLTSQSNQAFSAAGGSSAFQTLSFSNGNGVSFTNTNGQVGATVKTDYAASDHSHGNPTLALTNLSGTTASNSNGLTLSLSAAAGGGADGVNILAAGTQTANTTGTVVFSNSNNVSFGMSNSSIITASASYSQSTQPVAISGSNGSFAFSTATFGNLNGMSFYTSNGSMVGSYTVPTQSVQTQNMVSVEGSTGNIDFANANGITFGFNASTITASHNGLTTARASNDAIGLNTAQSNVTWTANSAGLSLDARGYAGTATATTGSISITLNSAGLSLNSPTFLTTAALSNHSHGNPTLALTNLSGTTASASNGLTLSLSAAAGGGVNPVASASNGSFSFTTLGFSNANNVTFGTSAGSIITASVAAPGAAAENNWFELAGNTAGNSTASGSTIQLIGGNNITLSGTNGSQIQISAPSAVTVSRYNEFKESPMVAGQIGQGSLHIQPWLVPNLHMDRVVQHVAFSNASNSSFSFTISNWVGIYTRNVSTLSLLHSISQSTNFTGSGTVGSYSLYGGAGYRGLTAGLTQTLTEGMYWIGVLSRTTTGGGAGHTLNQMLNSNVNSSYSGLIGAASNATNQISLGMGVYTATSSAMPSSIAFTQINGNSSIMLRPPSIYFVSGTV